MKKSTTLTIRISNSMNRKLIRLASINERSKAFICRSILAKELDIDSEGARYDLEETIETIKQ